MTTGVPAYSTTAASNTNANTGVNWDEGMNPGAVNNSARANMADLRSFANDLIWFQYGSGTSPVVTPAYASGTSFTVAGIDVTTPYHAGRRVKAVGSGTGTIYGSISSSSFSTNTTVNVTWDSGSLTNEALTIYLSQIPVTGKAWPSIGYLTTEGTVTSATTTDLSTSSAVRQNITGTTTITGFGSGANLLRILRFSGILTLTHDGTALILPGAANITTAAGDIALATSDGSGNWRVLSYTVAAAAFPASGTFTPTDASGASLSLTSPVGFYRRVGNMVTVWGSLTYPSTANGTVMSIGGLPFTSANLSTQVGGFVGTGNFTGTVSAEGGGPFFFVVVKNSATMTVRGVGGTQLTNADMSTNIMNFTITYPI